jgi:hypothetical protein
LPKVGLNEPDSEMAPINLKDKFELEEASAKDGLIKEEKQDEDMDINDYDIAEDSSK